MITFTIALRIFSLLQIVALIAAHNKLNNTLSIQPIAPQKSPTPILIIGRMITIHSYHLFLTNTISSLLVFNVMPFIKEPLTEYSSPVSESTKPSLVPSALKVCTLRNEVD